MIIEARDRTVSLRGKIKSNIWPAIQAAAALLLENHPTGIVIDCSGITDFNTRGAETFADAFKYIQSHNARIVVAALSPELIEIAKEVPGVRSQLPLSDTVEAALDSLELEELTPKRGRAREAALVPILGNWQRAMFHADRLAIGENYELHVVDFIKVPLTLPIGSPLPEREAEGLGRIEEAKEASRQYRIKTYSHVERVRSFTDGIIDYANQLNATLAVLNVDRPSKTMPYMEEREALAIMEEASFEVSIIKGSPQDANYIPKNTVIPVVGEWKHAVEHACKLLSDTESEITLLSIIVVPRTEPIDIPKPDAQIVAENNAKEAIRIGRNYGVKIKPVVERVRDPIVGLMRIIKDSKFDMAVVGVGSETEDAYSSGRSVALALFEELPCETVFLRVSR